MAEIYRDSTGKALDLGIEDALVEKVEFIRGEEVVAEAYDTPATIPYKITHEDGDFLVKWYYNVEGDEYTRTESHAVVTPLFSKQDLLDEDAMYSTLTDAQVVELELLIRKIIEAHTGQHFGYREGLVMANGSGFNYLTLPERAISTDSPFDIINNGYGVKYRGYYSVADNVKVPAEEEVISQTGVIGFAKTPYFKQNHTYAVYGKFGWVSVPEDVRKAALILAELFSCDETTWRDRYIKSIRAADWRFDYDGGTYRGTGSVSADQLLAKYVIGGIYVV